MMSAEPKLPISFGCLRLLRICIKAASMLDNIHHFLYVIERYGSLCHLKYLGDMCAIIPFFTILVALSIYECWYNLIFRYSYAIEYVTYRIWLQPGNIGLLFMILLISRLYIYCTFQPNCQTDFIYFIFWNLSKPDAFCALLKTKIM